MAYKFWIWVKAKEALKQSEKQHKINLLFLGALIKFIQIRVQYYQLQMVYKIN